MVRASARSEDVRAEVAELLGVGVEDVQPSCQPHRPGPGLHPDDDPGRSLAPPGHRRRFRHAGRHSDHRGLVRAGNRRLAGRKSPTSRPHPPRREDAAGEPFPLAPMQHAMWVGRHDNQQLGGVAGHLYVEFDGGPIDPGPTARGGRGAGAGAIRCCGCGSCPTAPSASRRPGVADAFPVAVEDLRAPGRQRGRSAAGGHPRRQIAPAARRRGVRARVDAAARRSVRACTSIWTCRPPTR